jgi:hypothetical protein
MRIVDGRQRVARRQRNQPISPPGREECIAPNQKRIGPLLDRVAKAASKSRSLLTFTT